LKSGRWERRSTRTRRWTGFGRDLVRGGVEGAGIAAGTFNGNNDVGRFGRRIAPRCRIELERGVGVDDAVVGNAVIDAYEISQVRLAGFSGFEDCGEIGDVALDMPGRAEGGAGLGGGAVVDVGVAEIKGGCAVVLAARGDGEVGGEDDLGPGTGAGTGRRVAIGLGVVVREFKILK